MTRALLLLAACTQAQDPGGAAPPGDSAATDTAGCSAVGFGDEADWALPPTDVPVRALSDATCSGEDDELHQLLDLNGDHAPDLVRLYGCDRTTDFGNTHWLVHENTGQGFAAAATTWPLPALTEPFAFHEAQDGACENDPDHLFDIRDMTGDHRPDLVVLSDCDPETDLGRYAWWVFENTGSGFAPDPIEWQAPAELAPDQWRRTEQDQCGLDAADLYGLHDLDGDHRPELVRFAGCAGEGQFDFDGTWRVWRNDGTGFAAEPEVWTMPTDVGGNWDGVEAFNCKGDEDHLFVARDLTGDSVLDLVVTSGCDTDPAWDERWRVYPGTGQGFDDAVDWPIPSHRAPGAWQFVLSTECVRSTDSRGGLIDLDGDDLPELIRFGSCWGDAVPRTWTVHRNLGDRFAEEESAWWLPDDREPNTWATLTDRQCDDPTDQLLEITDLNGDHTPDVVGTYGCSGSSAVGRDAWTIRPGGCLD